MFGKLKTIFLIVMALQILCIVALSQTAEKKPERNFKVEGEVYAVTQQWADAMTRGDDEALSQVLSDDVIVTFSSGKSRGKKDQLEAAKRIIFFTLNDLRLSVNSNTALVTCYANIRYTANDKEVEEERQYTSTLLNQQGKWRIVAQQINITSQSPSPPVAKSLSENSTVDRTASSVQTEPKVASSENGYKIGQRIPAGEFAITVLGIETSRSSYTDTYAVKAGNTLLAVQVKLETNQWNPFHTIAKQNALLIGRNGSYNLSAHGGKAPSFNTPQIVGGKSATGWLTFEIPEGESDFILSYKSWGSEDLRVSLGGSQRTLVTPVQKEVATSENSDPGTLTRAKMQAAIDEFFSRGRATGKIIDFWPNPAFGDVVAAEIQVTNFTYKPTAAESNELMIYSGKGQALFQRDGSKEWVLKNVNPGIPGYPWMPANVRVK